MVDNRLVEKILKQGQKLRASMIESILENDPFNTDILYKKDFCTLQSSRANLSKNKILASGDHNPCSDVDEKRLDAFIRGECMTKEEEQLALDTLQSLSAPELCRTTARSLTSQVELCQCTTCSIYNSYLKSTPKQRTEINSIHDTTINTLHGQPNPNLQLLDYVDSLKLSINNLKLTERGIQKVLAECPDEASILSINFFLEYHIPAKVISSNIQDRSFSQNCVRLCAKLSNNSVSFKHVSIHTIQNLASVSLDQINLEFKVCYRCPKRKSSYILGYAKFNFGEFIESEGLTCRNLSVFISNKTPIVIGTLKLSVQLGCDRLYFGQEFIDAIKSSELERAISENDASTGSLTRIVPPLDVTKPKLKEANTQTDRKYVTVKKYAAHTENFMVESKENKCLTKHTQTYSSPVIESGRIINNDYARPNKNNFSSVTLEDSQVLLGFIYVSEAQFLGHPTNTYIVCQLFSEKETSAPSSVIFNTSSPVYNFSQLVPTLLNNELLNNFRENFMLIEFWKIQDSKRSLIGLAKISLHQFYLAYKNPVISQHLLKRELPAIGTDDWVPVYCPNKDKLIGKVEVLTALGSEEQINKLKLNRGFSSVKPKFSNSTQEIQRKPDPLTSEPSTPRSSHHSEKLRNLENLADQEEQTSSRKDCRKGVHGNKIQQSSRTDINNLSKSSSRSQGASQNFKLHSTTDKVTEETKGVDIGTQSDMDGNKDNPPSTQDMLSSFMNQLIEQRQRNVCVENSTNTEPLHIEVNNAVSVQDARQKTNVELKRTSDLLDMLQNALNTDTKEREPKTKCCGQGKFNATVRILSANHLPSRKKCKPKNRSLKSEDILPSCYVTFETLIDSELHTTPVVSKSSSPVWNYTRDVTLSADLLTNGQKRLIFKVWRKSTNAVTCPNMQTDAVLGFAAVDLSVLLAGFPVIQGWFNIMDFCGKCNGQINIHITPLEDLSKYQSNTNSPKVTVTDNRVQPPDQQEPSELLSRALKRKFVELDEITQRLRLRLSEVTNESDSSSDGMTDEFEKDINSLCIEDDFDTVNFELEAKKIQNAVEIDKPLENTGVSLLMKDQDGKSVPSRSNLTSCSENSVANRVDSDSSISMNKTDGSVDHKNCNRSLRKEVAEKETSQFQQPLDKQLQEGKQHINSLLEKLTLLSSGTVTSRYVSGCSTSGTNLDTEAILEELDHSSRPNIQSTLGFDPLNFQQLYGDSVLNQHSAQTSSSSLVTEFNGSRAPPVGEDGSSDSVSTVLNND
nr:unnamed protein product [Callosobruchus chinensis]